MGYKAETHGHSRVLAAAPSEAPWSVSNKEESVLPQTSKESRTSSITSNCWGSLRRTVNLLVTLCLYYFFVYNTKPCMIFTNLRKRGVRQARSLAWVQQTSNLQQPRRGWPMCTAIWGAKVQCKLCSPQPGTKSRGSQPHSLDPPFSPCCSCPGWTPCSLDFLLNDIIALMECSQMPFNCANVRERQ